MIIDYPNGDKVDTNVAPAEPPIDKPRDRVVFVTIEYDDGSIAKMEFSGYPNESGTSYVRGTRPYDSTALREQDALENAITEAVTNLGLWPELRCPTCGSEGPLSTDTTCASCADGLVVAK